MLTDLKTIILVPGKFYDRNQEWGRNHGLDDYFQDDAFSGFTKDGVHILGTQVGHQVGILDIVQKI